MTTIAKSAILHPSYQRYADRWQLIKDVIAGKEDIDLQGVTYLPRPSGRNDPEYEAYQKRAVLYNATARTLEGYLGAIFRKQADYRLPPEVEYLEDDTDGEGNTLTQFSKEVTRDVIAYGRHGLLVDYPNAANIKTLEDERKSNMQAHIKSYCPQSIVNWATRRIGAKTVLTHVLLEERCREENSNVFDYKEHVEYKYLYLDDNGLYTVQQLKEITAVEKNNPRKAFVDYVTYQPKLPNGKRLDFIPFIFVGSLNATPEPDSPPLYDLAQLNLAHYRNSADFEEAVFMVGQPTPWITGLSMQFIEQYQNQMKIGSRTAWLLPENCSVGLLESKSDRNLILEAMRLKELEMVGIGARLIQDTSNRGSESTESVQLRRSGEASLLACISDNVSIAITKAIMWSSMWMGSKNPDASFRLNKDFFSNRLSATEIRELVAAWQSGAIPQDVLLDNLRKGEVVSEIQSNEQIKSLLEDEEPSLLVTQDDRPDNEEAD